MNATLQRKLIEAVTGTVIAHADELTTLDQAIGDGDHGLNMSRGAAAADATVPMRATKGRASFLGERSIGHMDPGARSSSLMIAAICVAMKDCAAMKED